MHFLDRIIACVDKIIPTRQTDSTKEWKRVADEGRALCEEIEKLSEKSKEDTESTE